MNKPDCEGYRLCHRVIWGEDGSHVPSVYLDDGELDLHCEDCDHYYPKPVPLTVCDWFKDKHPKVYKKYPTLDALRDKIGPTCAICRKHRHKGTSFCLGHLRAWNRWRNEQ